jgi:hypothetical protein
LTGGARRQAPALQEKIPVLLLRPDSLGDECLARSGRKSLSFRLILYQMTDDSVCIETNFPGGNILVDGIEGDTVHLRPDLRDTDGHWFYWNFRIRGAAGRRLRFQFDSQAGLAIGARGPAVSHDDGRSWEWLGADHTGIPEDEFFNYEFRESEESVRFAFCIPYQLADWNRFATSLQNHYTLTTLCRTRKGREVPVLEIGDNAERPLVVVTARHHCCESAASYVLEGLVSGWEAAVGEAARLWAIPFVDLDGVEAGDQGKNRRPHDHNRDYTEEPLYPETRALMERIRSEAGPFMALDLHCPYARGEHNEDVYIVGSADAAMARRQAAFGEVLETVAAGLPYSRSNDVPFGTAWNTGGNYKTGKSSATWFSERENCQLAATIEIPYANAGGTIVTPESCRAFGASLARAIRLYRSSGSR